MKSRSAKSRKSRAPATKGFRCATCGQWHEDLPLDYFYDSPAYWNGLSLKDKKLSFLNADLCSIKGEDFFVRGVLEIPVRNSEVKFRWGVWVSLSKKNFDRAVKLWDDPRLLQEPPYFGWLSSIVEGYPDTLSLKTKIQYRNLQDRPYIELEATGHPLAIEQRRGITLARVCEIARFISRRKSGS